VGCASGRGRGGGLAAIAPFNLKKKSRCRLAAGAAGCHISDNQKLQNQGRGLRLSERVKKFRRRPLSSSLPCNRFSGLLAPAPDSLLEKVSVGRFGLPGFGELGAVAARPTIDGQVVEANVHG
jgi:hypothetical protein